jgi:capsular polysaccharide transport system permease protein
MRLVYKIPKSFQVFVIIPFAGVLFYQIALAARIFESESRFVIRRMGENAGVSQLGIPLLGAGGASNKDDAVILKEYLTSPNILEKLDQPFGLRKHYLGFGKDFLRYFSPNATKEEFLKAYRQMVQVDVLPESSVVRLKVQAYNPETAEALASAIAKEGEGFVNRISEELANEQINFVRNEVKRAEEKLREIRQNLASFKNDHAILDPEKQSASAISLVAAMESKLVDAKAERIRLLSYLKEDAQEVISNHQQIDSLEQQIEEERSKLTGTTDNTLNKVLEAHNALQLDAEFALEAYKAAYTSLEAARLEASRKLKHFVTLSSTGLPESPVHPRFLYASASSLIILLLLYGVFHLIRATILDHKL